MKKSIFNDSMLMILIHHLNEKEFKALGLWVRSPIHNSSKNVIALYDILKKKYYATQKSPNALSVMRYMGILPKGARHNNISTKHKQDLRQTMSRLTTQIRNFLAWKKTQENPIEHNRLVMDALREKQLFELMHKTMKRTRKIQQASLIRNTAYCIDNYKLAEIDFYMNIALKNRDVAGSLKDVVHSLEQSCLSQLLYYYCVVSNAKRIIKTADFPFMEVVKNYVEKSGDKQVFTVGIYYRLLKLLEDEQAEDYYVLKTQLFESQDAFTTNELRQFLNFMSNYCKRRLKQGDSTFLKEQFDVFLTGLEYDCWTTGVHFPPNSFVEIVQTSLSLDKLAWTDRFLSEYGDKLPLNSKDNTLNYCLALAAFHKKDYNLAQEHLVYITAVEDFAYRIKFRVLLIKIYYDKNELTLHNAEEHSINNEIETLRKYVLSGVNKSMSENVRQQYSNFANFFKRILARKKKLLFGGRLTQQDITTLQRDLVALTPLIERSWLKEKIADLMGKTEK